MLSKNKKKEIKTMGLGDLQCSFSLWILGKIMHAYKYWVWPHKCKRQSCLRDSRMEERPSPQHLWSGSCCSLCSWGGGRGVQFFSCNKNSIPPFRHLTRRLESCPSVTETLFATPAWPVLVLIKKKTRNISMDLPEDRLQHNQYEEHSLTCCASPGNSVCGESPLPLQV